MKARRAVDLDVPSAAPCEATLKDRRAAGPEATVKEQRAADRSFALAAASELTIRERAEWPTWRVSERPAQAELPIVLPDLDKATVKERSAAGRTVPSAAPFEATLKERSAADRRVPPATSFDATVADRHVPSAAPFEATIKGRSTVDLGVPPPVSPASERPTARPSGWLTWWLTWRPDESLTPAEPPMVPPANAQRAPTGTPMPPVIAQPVVASFAADVRSPITRRARAWIVVAVLIVTTIGGTVALVYGATNDPATNTTNLDAGGGDP